MRSCGVNFENSEIFRGPRAGLGFKVWENKVPYFFFNLDFPSTFEIWVNKVTSVLFLLLLIGWDKACFSYFLVTMSAMCLSRIWKKAIPQLLSQNWNISGHLFFTSQDKENKEQSFFCLLRGWNTAFFLFSINHVKTIQPSNLENGYISASEQKLKKLRTLSFIKFKSSGI